MLLYLHQFHLRASCRDPQDLKNSLQYWQWKQQQALWKFSQTQAHNLKVWFFVTIARTNILPGGSFTTQEQV